jgi:hypothetical protein
MSESHDSNTRGVTYVITCDSMMTYVITCIKCIVQYVDQTSRQLRDSFVEHLGLVFDLTKRNKLVD